MKLSEIATNYNQIASLKEECNVAFATFFKLNEEIERIVKSKFELRYETDWSEVVQYLIENGFIDDSTQNSTKFSCGDFAFVFKSKDKLKPMALCEFDVYLKNRIVFYGQIDSVFVLEEKDVCTSKNSNNSYFRDERTNDFEVITKFNYQHYIDQEVDYCSNLTDKIERLQGILNDLMENIDDINRKIENSSEWSRCYELWDNVRGELWTSIQELFENEINPLIFKCN